MWTEPYCGLTIDPVLQVPVFPYDKKSKAPSVAIAIA